MSWISCPSPRSWSSITPYQWGFNISRAFSIIPALACAEYELCPWLLRAPSTARLYRSQTCKLPAACCCSNPEHLTLHYFWSVFSICRVPSSNSILTLMHINGSLNAISPPEIVTLGFSKDPLNHTSIKWTSEPILDGETVYENV